MGRSDNGFGRVGNVVDDAGGRKKMEDDRSEDGRIDGMNEGIKKSHYGDQGRAFDNQCVSEIVNVNGIDNGSSK